MLTNTTSLNDSNAAITADASLEILQREAQDALLRQLPLTFCSFLPIGRSVPAEEVYKKLGEALKNFENAHSYLKQSVSTHTNLTTLSLDHTSYPLKRERETLPPHYFYYVSPDPKDKNKILAALFSLLWIIKCLHTELKYAQEIYSNIIEKNNLDAIKAYANSLENNYRNYILFLVAASNPQATHTSLDRQRWESEFRLARGRDIKASYTLPVVTYCKDILKSFSDTKRLMLIDGALQAKKGGNTVETYEPVAARLSTYINGIESELTNRHGHTCEKLSRLHRPINNTAETISLPQINTPSITPVAVEAISVIYTTLIQTPLFSNKNSDYFLGDILKHAEKLCGIHDMSNNESRIETFRQKRNKGGEKFYKGALLFTLLRELYEVANNKNALKSKVDGLSERYYEYRSKKKSLFQHRHHWRNWFCCSQSPTTTEKKFTRIIQAVNRAH